MNVSFSTAQDAAERAAQQATEAFADLLTEAKITTNFDRTMVIWQLLRRLEQEAAFVGSKVSERAEQLSRGYGHGV